MLLSLVVLFAPTDGGGSPPVGADKVVHLLLFAALAGTARWRFGRVALVLAAVAGYAVLSEIAQAFVLPGRSGDPYDVLADLTGAGLGWLLARRARP